MADLNPPIKAKIQQALTILEEEEFTEYIKQQLKGEMAELDYQSTDVEQIAKQIADFRIQAQGLDLFMNKLREYINE